MSDARSWFTSACAVLLSACAADTATTAPDVEVESAALAAASPCNEMVPANRNIDGVPAYAQCMTSENSAVFSNNGIDTSLTSLGSDWVKTQYSGGYQCTEFAHRYLYFRWNVKWIPNGNAGNWCDTQPPANSGVVQTMTPVHGDIMVLAGGSCGAAQSTGHVNIIDTVNGTKLTAVEQNRAGRSPYMLSCGKCFLHVMANDGTPKALDGAPTTAATATPSMPTATPPAMAPPVPDQTRTPSIGLPTSPSLPQPNAQAGAPAAAATPAQPSAASTGPASLPASSATTGAAGSAATTTSAPRSTLRAPAEPAGCSIVQHRLGGTHSPAALGWLALAGLALLSRPARNRRR